MSEIVERLKSLNAADHIRGCEGRNYSCDCGYDEDVALGIDDAIALIEQQAREIADLTAAGDAMASYLESEQHNYACGIWKGNDCTCGLDEALADWQQAKGEVL